MRPDPVIVAALLIAPLSPALAQNRPAAPAAVAAPGPAAPSPAAPGPAADADWNPRPADGDLAVPLPCGQSIVFRRVATPMADSPLADRRAVLGDEQAEAAYAEFVRDAFVGGSFGRGADAHFWLGKYEVTRAQYAAVVSGCPAVSALPANQRRLPQGGVSLADAVRFAEGATAAALRIRRDALPGEGEARAFMRLPGEAEWEYAARGGAAVTDAEFRGRLPPMDGPVAARAQLRRTGQRPAPQPVGALSPDRLGLHDMLGNVEEMVGDPFRLTRGGRAGGRTGGIVARGGDVALPPDAIRTSLRVEYAPHAADGAPFTAPTLGFRVALGLPILPDLAAAGALRAAWEREAARAEEALSPDADPRALAQRLEADTADPARRRALASLRSAVEEERSRRTQAEERAARTAIGAGASLVQQFRQGLRYALTLERAIQLAEAETAAGKSTTRVRAEERENAAVYRASNERTFEILKSLILQQGDIAAATIEAQLRVWQNENAAPAFDLLRRYAAQFVAEVSAARGPRAVNDAAARERLAGDVVRDVDAPLQRPR